MYLARGGWHFVGRQIEIVGASGCHAAGGGKLVGNRTDRRVLQWHGGLQRFGWIMLCRFVHNLNPNRQCERGTISVWNDRCRLIEPDPHATSQCVGITNEPGILVIIGGAGLACRRQFESKRTRAGGGAL